MRRSLPPLNALRAFEATARHEHLSRAADELCVTHSALSQQIKSLETWFDMKLFTRENGRLSLNEEGKELLAVSTTILDSLQAVSIKLRKQKAGKSLVIHCDPAFFSKCLMKAMQSLRQTAGDTAIDVVTSHSQNESSAGNADIVVYFGMGQDKIESSNWTGMHYEHLFDISGFPACSPLLLDRYPVPETPNDLKYFHLLHGKDRKSWQGWLSKYCSSPCSGRKNTFYDDFSLTIQAAVNGDGVIMADSILCRSELESGLLTPLFTDTIFELNFSACCTKANYQDPGIRAVFDCLVKEMRSLSESTQESLKEPPELVAYSG